MNLIKFIMFENYWSILLRGSEGVKEECQKLNECFMIKISLTFRCLISYLKT